MDIMETIVAAGPLSAGILQISATKDNTLLIRTPDNSFLTRIIGHRVVFEAVIDTPIGEHRARVLAALLTYNAVWQDTGHIRMALTGNGPDAEAILIADLILDENFTDQYVADVIEDLDAKIQIWRDIIAGGADDGAQIFSDENNVRV